MGEDVKGEDARVEGLVVLEATVPRLLDDGEDELPCSLLGSTDEALAASTVGVDPLGLDPRVGFHFEVQRFVGIRQRSCEAVEGVGEEFRVLRWGVQDAGEAVLLSVVLDVEEDSEDCFAIFLLGLVRLFFLKLLYVGMRQNFRRA